MYGETVNGSETSGTLKGTLGNIGGSAGSIGESEKAGRLVVGPLEPSEEPWKTLVELLGPLVTLLEPLVRNLGNRKMRRVHLDTLIGELRNMNTRLLSVSSSPGLSIVVQPPA
ncbi:hypothetical protein CHARACLAT_019208 [Characodon lateralis]|uniref:Uncharacterized protein n=1 Tax=Characodon lateralis TaxID=208331 RepID=A0ABU7D834_9TELE|nr:hypothetical protein [Characodon lateralis]